MLRRRRLRYTAIFNVLLRSRRLAESENFQPARPGVYSLPDWGTSATGRDRRWGSEGVGDKNRWSGREVADNQEWTETDESGSTNKWNRRD